jgi:hypothetical protein
MSSEWVDDRVVWVFAAQPDDGDATYRVIVTDGHMIC